MVKKLGRRTRLLLGVAIGACLMFLFDPQHGDARRTRLREQLRSSRPMREDELAAEVQPRPVGSSTPASPAFEAERTVTPRPLAG